MKVMIDSLSKVIEKELQTYKKVTTERLKETVREVAHEAKELLQYMAPKKSGKYAKSWTIKVNYDTRSISENATWGIRKRFERGEVQVNATKFMGYDKDEDGKLIINPEQAQVVRDIYKLYMDGYSPEYIARHFNSEGIKGWSGKANWCPGAILKMLQNEKYKGDALLQKT